MGTMRGAVDALPGPRGVLAAAVVSATLACSKAPPPRHVVLVTVDTLRADHLGAYAGRPGLTPNLDALAARSEVFESAYAPTPFTLPSVAAIHSGRFPMSVRVTANGGVLGATVPTLAQWLSGRGFRSAAVVSNIVLARAAGLDGGFDRYDDQMPQLDGTRGLPWRRAAATTRDALRALDAIRTSGERTFLWVHYQDPHGPYDPPAGYREREYPAALAAPDARRELAVGSDDSGLGALPRYQYLSGQRTVAFYRAGYAGAVRYLDEHVGALLRGLSERGLLDAAVVAFTADHGEALGEGDYWFAHGEYLTQTLVRVPLFLYRPGGTARRRPDVATLQDLARTLSAAVGAEWKANEGRNLFARLAPLRDSPVVLSNFAGGVQRRVGAVAGAYKYVATRDGTTWQEEVYELGHGGRETLVSNPGDRVAALRARLNAYRDQAAATPDVRRELSPEERERLRALGYVLER